MEARQRRQKLSAGGQLKGVQDRPSPVFRGMRRNRGGRTERSRVAVCNSCVFRREVFAALSNESGVAYSMDMYILRRLLSTLFLSTLGSSRR